MRLLAAAAVLALIGAGWFLAARGGDLADPRPRPESGTAEHAPAEPPSRRSRAAARDAAVTTDPDGAAQSGSATEEPAPPAIHPLRGNVRTWDGVAAAGAIVRAEPLPVLPRAPDPRKSSEAACDGGGAFGLPPLAAGDWTLFVAFDGAVRVFGATVSVPEAAAIDLVLPRGGVIEGTVVDAETRAPLAGAGVRLVRYGDCIADVTASAAGRFRMAYFGRPTSGEFLVASPGYEREASAPEFDDSVLGRQLVVVEVRRGVVVRGVVTSPDGPVAGASVVVASNSFVSDDPSKMWSATTDAHGAFAVEGYPRDETSCNVRITASGLLLADEPDPDLAYDEGSERQDVYRDFRDVEDRVAEIRMRRRVPLGHGTVTGRVVDEDGAPVAGIVVRSAQRSCSARTTSGADGTFTLEGLLADEVEREVSVVAERAGVRAGSAWVMLSAGGRADCEDLVLDEKQEPPRHLRGRVTADGAPVEGARVFVYAFQWEAQLRCFGGPRIPPSAIVVRTGRDGAFDVERGPGDAVRLEVVVEGFAVWRRMIDDDGIEARYDVALVRPRAVQGRVVRAGGAVGLAGVRVSIWRDDPQDYGEDDVAERTYRESVVAVTAADGSFRVPSLDFVEEKLLFSAPGWATAQWEFDEDDATSDPSAVVVELAPSAALSGRVETEDGRPAIGVRLAVQGPDDRLAAWFTEDPPTADDPLNDPSETIAVADDGSFRLDDLPAGATRVMVLGGTPPVRRVFLDPGGTEVRRIVVVPGKSIRGRVTRPDGSAAAGVVVRARPEGEADAVAVAAATGADGAFVIEGLGNGPHELTCGVAGAFRWNRRGVLPGGGEVRIELDAGLSVSGSIREADGTGLRYENLVAEPADPDSKLTTRTGRTDDEGRFSIPTLLPGRWRLRAPDHARIPSVEVEAGDSEIVLTATPKPDDDR